MTSTRLLGAIVAMIVSLTRGCGENQDAPSAPEDAEPESEQADMAENEEEELDFEGLSLEDRKLAKAQKVCPVSDQKLGSMGTPIKIEYDGKVIFFCCQMCKPRFEKDPETYLAKLQKK